MSTQDQQPESPSAEKPVSESVEEPVADADPPTEVVEDTAEPVDSPVAEPAVAEPAEPLESADEPAEPAEPVDEAAVVAEEPHADADPPTELVDDPIVADQDTDPDTSPADSPAGSEVPAEDAEELRELTDAELECTLEALLLVVDSPVDEESLAAATDTTVARVSAALLRMAADYTDHGRGLDLRNTGGGWRYHTRDRYAPYVEKLLLGGQRAKLTRAALETLAVIAYRQPVTRARVAAVRGVNCDGVIRTLLARGLVEETGTDLETGGFLYRTTELFLERLGLSSLEDLPPIAPLLPEVDSIDDV
ncbi:SMC-Scp complex subunit ScpB [Actinophytocola sediminis]